MPQSFDTSVDPFEVCQHNGSESMYVNTGRRSYMLGNRLIKLLCLTHALAGKESKRKRITN